MSRHAKTQPALWGLLDCNNFYASCEKAFRPDLIGKPIVVLSNNDGCIVARSAEAKALGIKMGEPAFKAADILRRHRVEVFSSNYELYGDLSRRVMRNLDKLADIEQYSIDECFIRMGSAMAVQAEAAAKEFKRVIQKNVWIPVSVGVGSTRTLAKVANHLAKKSGQGVLVLRPGSAELEDALERTSVEDVWGIGRRFAKRLLRYGVTTARHLRDMDPDLALRVLTVVGQRTVLELRGEQCITLDDPGVVRKTLVSSRSFGSKISRKSDLAESLAMHASIAAEKLRREGLLASVIHVFCSTSLFGDEPGRSIGTRVSLPVPANDTLTLVSASRAALDSCFRPGPYIKAGVMVVELAEKCRRQLTLLEACAPPEGGQRQALMEAFDVINAKYGRDTIRTAAQGARGAPWHMKRSKKSPNYTTDWEELAKAG